MTVQQFYNGIDKILEIPEGSIKGNESLRDFEQWDSLAVLSFISMADSDLGILVSPDALAKCQTVADLVRLFPGKISLAEDQSSIIPAMA